MTNLSPIEENYIATTSIQSRKELGQFFTPKPIADVMVRWASYGYRTRSFLDPGVGSGVFVRSLLEGRRGNSIRAAVSIDGIDIDANIMSLAENNVQPSKSESLRFIREDFLRFETSGLYQSIVCNPPYLKHHWMKNKVDNANSVKSIAGYDLPISTNSYCLFMFRSRALIGTPGRCAFIIPSEFLNANYGVAVKRYLAADASFKGIVLFNFNTAVFDDAITTACIVLFENGGIRSEVVTFVTIRGPDQLEDAFGLLSARDSTNTLFGWANREKIGVLRRDKLEPTRKWKNYFATESRKQALSLVPLSKYASCSRGIATGANDFFTMSEPTRQKLSIGMENLIPCVTKSAGVPGLIFTKEHYRGLVKAGARVYLLRPLLPLSPAVEIYLKQGEAQEVPLRYLPSHRDPWYSPENQRPACIWAMVFSRNRTRFIWNKAGVNHLTTFHGIYPNSLGQRLLKPLLLFLWSDFCQDALEEQQRQYGNGLKKYEPRDIERMLVPDFERCEAEWLSGADKIFAKITPTTLNDGVSSQLRQDIERFFRATWLSG